MKKMTNLEAVYDILVVWFSRFEGAHDISIHLTEHGISITACWFYPENPDDRQLAHVQYTLSRQEMENCIEYPILEEKIMNEIERVHMKWEVGEE